VVELVIRTRKPLFKSKSIRYLSFATLLIVAATIILSFIPHAQIFGFIALPPFYLYTVGLIVLIYIITTG
jgi:P-type Mg2+ transporter